MDSSRVMIKRVTAKEAAEISQDAFEKKVLPELLREILYTASKGYSKLHFGIYGYSEETVRKVEEAVKDLGYKYVLDPDYADLVISWGDDEKDE